MVVAEAAMFPGGENTSQVRLLHDLAKIHATCYDQNLVSRAGLVPVMALAQRAGLMDHLPEQLHRVGAEYLVVLCDLGILADQTAEAIPSCAPGPRRCASSRAASGRIPAPS